MTDADSSITQRLNALLVEAGLAPVERATTASQFGTYLSLILRWNAHLNLTALRDEGSILTRHFVESIACARALPAGICTLLDFGSGAGLPGIPIALCRPEIAVTLAESQGKKAAFLHEVVRVLGIPVQVHADRAESLDSKFDCVAMRAVERMAKAVKAAAKLVGPTGWLALMTTERELDALKSAAGADYTWPTTTPLPGGERRLAAFGVRAARAMPALADAQVPRDAER